MATQLIPHQEPSTDSAILAVAETVSAVANKLHDDINLVAHACAIHEQLLLQLMSEVERMRITNDRLYIRLLHLERKEKKA